MTRARDVANVLSTATSLATDTETAAAISSHNSATTSVHGISNTATLATQTYADSAVSTHAAAADPHTVYLKESEYWAAGKNKIINGDFLINQRNFTSGTANGYGIDRWVQIRQNGTVTYSVQTFTVGSAPVAGYEGKFYARQVVSGHTNPTSDYATLSQRIESVRTLAGQTVTISFWARSGSGTPKVAVGFRQYMGTGGSPSADVDTYISQVTLSTSWTRYSVTGTLPSISGKTIGTNNDDALWFYLYTSAGTDYNALTGSLGSQNNTFDFWGVQVEAGSTATPFTTATGTFQGELAACQRYCYRRTTGSGGYGMATITAYGANDGYARIDLPVRMRTTPTATLSGTASHYRAYINNLVNLTQISLQEANTDFALFSVTVTGNGLYGVGAAGWLASDASSNGYIQLNAEL